MKHTPETTQAHVQACPQPDPAQDRAGPAVPANIAVLLCIVSKLLEYGRHLAATIERRAAMPGFSLFAVVFGTRNLPVILAYLHRGILRATALESLLRKRAATGRDLAPAPLRPRAQPGTNAKADPGDEPVNTQAARLAAERARDDAPIDPDNLPTREEIEAEVRANPIGRTIAAICRDFGIVPGMCTREFWDTLSEAIASHEGSILTCWQHMLHKPEQTHQQQDDDPAQEQIIRDIALHPHRTLGFKIGERPVDPFRDEPAPARPRQSLPVRKHDAAASAEATGPPPPNAAIKRAA